MYSYFSSTWAWLLGSGILWYFLSCVISFVLANKSQIDEWAEKNPRVAGFMKILRGCGLDPWLISQGLSLLVRKRLPEKTRPPVLTPETPPSDPVA